MIKLKEQYPTGLEKFISKLELYHEIKQNKNNRIKYNILLEEIYRMILNNYNLFTKDELIYLYGKLENRHTSYYSSDIILASAKKYNIQINKEINIKKISEKCQYNFEDNIELLKRLDRINHNMLKEIIIEKEIINELKSTKNNKVKVK